MTDGKGDTLKTLLTSRSKASPSVKIYVHYHHKTHTYSLFCKRSQHRVREVENLTDSSVLETENTYTLLNSCKSVGVWEKYKITGI